MSCVHEFCTNVRVCLNTCKKVNEKRRNNKKKTSCFLQNPSLSLPVDKRIHPRMFNYFPTLFHSFFCLLSPTIITRRHTCHIDVFGIFHRFDEKRIAFIARIVGNQKMACCLCVCCSQQHENVIFVIVPHH